MSFIALPVPHRDYPERSVYNTLHFCEFCDSCTTIPYTSEFCDSCTTIPYTSVSSVAHPVPYRDYPPVLCTGGNNTRRTGKQIVELPSTIVITPGGWHHLQEPTLKCTLTNNTQNTTLPRQRNRNRSVTEHTIRHAASEREHERCRPQQFIYARSWWHLSLRRLGCVYSGKWGGTEYWV